MKTFQLKMAVWLVLLFPLVFSAAEYRISSVDEFDDLNLSPGDVVIWEDGTYNDEERLTFSANGTANNPITLRAETPGGVIFTGEFAMDIGGDNVIVDGFYWFEGAGTNNHVQFRDGEDYANNSTIRNCGFNNLTPSGTDKHRWVVLYGTNNTVENCSFLNKNSPGALVLVELEYNNFNPVGHIIRDNYFFNYVKRDPNETHSGDSETIRVGTSEYQDKSASCLIEGNYFYKADGENEIITNKSANNTYRNNTFRACRGSLVLRHGANATVDGNYFLGENVDGTGGIRVTDSYHTIINNYIQDVVSEGDKWNNGITLVGGSDASGGTGNGYQRVDDVLIAFNTLYNVDSPIFYNDRSSYDPTGVLAYNVIDTDRTNIVSGDISGTGQGMDYVGNIANGASIGISDNGISSANANFSRSGEIFKPSSSGAAANGAGSTYSSQVNTDVEGRNRPNSNMDLGAHEVSGGSGSASNAPLTASDVGGSVGACFLSATGSRLADCSGTTTPPEVDDYLTVTSLSNFLANGGNQTFRISSNVSWVVNENASWVSINNPDGGNNGAVVVTVSANTGSNARNTNITVSGAGITRTVSVSQSGNSTEPPLPEGDCTEGNNLASNGSVIDFSNQQNTTNGAANVADENSGNRWSAEGFPQYVVVDLGGTYNVNEVNVLPYNGRAYQFTVEGSETNSSGNSFTLVNANGNTSGGSQINRSFNSTAVRYVRLTVTGASGYTGPWVSISDFEIICAGANNNAASCSSGSNLSENGDISDFSSEQNDINSADNLIDGNTGNRWSALSYPQDVTIDLGDNYAIDEINVLTYQDRAYQFLVQGSLSATSGFSTLTDARNNTNGGEVNRSFNTTTVRFVKLTFTGADNYDGDWISIREIEVICAGSGSNKSLGDLTTANIEVYPNPFVNSVTVSSAASQIAKASLTDLTGRMIFEKPVTGTATKIINLDSLPKGIYLLQLLDASNKIIQVKKLIKN